jgi:hypothetical protein
MIKDTLIVEDPDQEFIDLLQAREITFERKKDVNTNSLKAWFRRMLGIAQGTVRRFEEKDVPKEANLFPYWETTIK